MANDLENDNVDTIHATHNKMLQDAPTYNPPTNSKHFLLGVITSLFDIMDKDQIVEFCGGEEIPVVEELCWQYMSSNGSSESPDKFNEAVLEWLDREDS